MAFPVAELAFGGQNSQTPVRGWGSASGLVLGQELRSPVQPTDGGGREAG